MLFPGVNFSLPIHCQVKLNLAKESDCRNFQNSEVQNCKSIFQKADLNHFQLEYHQTIIIFEKEGAIKWDVRNSDQFGSWTGGENLKIVNKNDLWTIHAVQIGQITQTYTQSTTTTEFYYYCYEDHTLPWRGGMLLTGQVKGLGPSGGAAACISWPLPVGVTVKHTRKTWRGSLTRFRKK